VGRDRFGTRRDGRDGTRCFTERRPANIRSGHFRGPTGPVGRDSNRRAPRPPRDWNAPHPGPLPIRMTSEWCEGDDSRIAREPGPSAPGVYRSGSRGKRKELGRDSIPAGRDTAGHGALPSVDRQISGPDTFWTRRDRWNGTRQASTALSPGWERPSPRPSPHQNDHQNGARGKRRDGTRCFTERRPTNIRSGHSPRPNGTRWDGILFG
jgi:hypothetical protein